MTTRRINLWGKLLQTKYDLRIQNQNMISMKPAKQSQKYSNDNGPDVSISYKREPSSYPDGKRFSNKDRKAFKRKLRESKLIAQMEKEKKLRLEKEEGLRQVEEEKKKRERCGRPWTLAIALPGSILDNAQSVELRAYLAGRVARAACVFNVDEIIVFDESPRSGQESSEFSGLKQSGHGNRQLFHILQYLECPQYLRKSFFPVHVDLKHAGLLNPLDSPHHLRESDVSEYREGVTVKKASKKANTCYANIGLKKDALLDMAIDAGQRVTVKITDQDKDKKSVRGKVVSPNEPREASGLYWGYTVRLASCLGDVFSESPHEGGYDLTIGTSERGDPATDVDLTQFKHAVIVFGGLKGLEASLEADGNIHTDDPKDLFKHYVNVCSDQGSRTIRTEEALLIALSVLRPKLVSVNTQLPS